MGALRSTLIHLEAYLDNRQGIAQAELNKGAIFNQSLPQYQLIQTPTNSLIHNNQIL